MPDESSSDVTNFSANEEDPTFRGSGSSEAPNTISELESLSTPPHQSGSEDGETSEATKKSKKPRPSKAYFCIFCKKRKTHFPRHLTNMHSDKEEVREFLKHAPGTKQRMKLISKIRGQGAIEYNSQTTQEGSSSGSIQLGRRMTGIPIDTELYLPCLECGNYYKKRNLQTHYKKCANKAGPSNLLSKCRVRKLGHGIPSQAKVTMSEQLKEILGGMSASSNIMRLIECDPAIVAFGNKLCKTNKHIISTQVNSIRRNLKVMAVITTYMYEHDEGDPDKQLTVSYYYKHEKFDLFKKAVLYNIGYKEGTYNSASQAGAIGRIWFNCAKSLNDLYLDLGLREDKTQLDEWLQKFKSQYYVELEKPASAQLTRNRWNKKMTIPNDEEVATLCTYLKGVMRQHKTELRITFDYTHWAQLSKALLVYLTVFNRKRSGEVQGALLKQYRERVTYKDFADNWSERLSSQDVEQSKRYSRFLVKGKRSKGVSVLMEQNEVDSMELLLSNRQNANVDEDNDFLFAKAHTHFNCRSALREFAKVCQVKRHHLLTTTKLRKHFASSIPMLNLAGNEMTTVTQFLGHDEKTEALHYRMPDAVEEMAHVATLLYASTTMTMSKLKDRNLRSINHETTLATVAIPPDYLGSGEPPANVLDEFISKEPSAHLRRICSTDSSHSEEGEEVIRTKTDRRGPPKHRIYSSPELSPPSVPGTISAKRTVTHEQGAEKSERSTILYQEPQPSTSGTCTTLMGLGRHFSVATDSSSSDDDIAWGRKIKPKRLILSPSPERYQVTSPPYPRVDRLVLSSSPESHQTVSLPAPRANCLVLSPDIDPPDFQITSLDDGGGIIPTTTMDPPASTSTATDAEQVDDNMTANTPPKKIVRKRLPWTPRQTRVIEDNFKSYLDQKQIPPTYIIRKVLSDNGQVLRARTVESIRTHISNMNTGKTNRSKKIDRLDM
ncbi:hypothetical protein GE061_019044 [Apolygus lucorum]|uniref:Uncharacterized protein n=1 Tax=Apolygus lucorum TaxID=248454 RepID=A0A8S9X701_APOLU|nr:hypothetical protein GE061_019044 [Apolygus lucorum]